MKVRILFNFVYIGRWSQAQTTGVWALCLSHKLESNYIVNIAIGNSVVRIWILPPFYAEEPLLTVSCELLSVTMCCGAETFSCFFALSIVSCELFSVTMCCVAETRCCFCDFKNLSGFCGGWTVWWLFVAGLNCRWKCRRSMVLKRTQWWNSSFLPFKSISIFYCLILQGVTEGLESIPDDTGQW